MIAHDPAERPRPWHSYSWLEEELTQAGLRPEQVDAALAIRRKNEAAEYAKIRAEAKWRCEQENALILETYHRELRKWIESPWRKTFLKEPKRPTDRYGNPIP